MTPPVCVPARTVRPGTRSRAEGLQDLPVLTLAYGNGKWLASTDRNPRVAVIPVTFYTSRDARTWTKAVDIDGTLRVTTLAFGGSTSASTASTSGAPCTRAALQDAFSHEPDDDLDTAIINSYDPPICANGWAAVHYNNQGMHLLAVLRSSGATWNGNVKGLNDSYPR